MSTRTPRGARPPRKPRPPRTPRPDSSAAGFLSGLVSRTRWRERRGRVAGLFRKRRSGGRSTPTWHGGLQNLIDLDVPDDRFELETPALGDAYNFVVKVRCKWLVQGTAPADGRRRRTHEIRREIQEQRPFVREQIEASVRKAARHHAPYRAAAAEAEIGESLQSCRAQGDLHVKVVARVDICEAVREDLKTVWQQRLTEDAEGDSKKANVELIGELQEAWRDLLLDGLGGIGEVEKARTTWIAPYALALAQDPEESAGVYLSTMIKHRVSHAEDLLRELSDLVVNKNIDAIEFAFGSDSALRALLSLLGVPIPARSAANGKRANGQSPVPGGSFSEEGPDEEDRHA